jgi:aspartate ammonia-lyase
LAADSYRKERDLLGEVQLPGDALYGVHAARALQDFALSGRRVPEGIVEACGIVKLRSAPI